jgi:outer membrane cobalamin receptor
MTTSFVKGQVQLPKVIVEATEDNETEQEGTFQTSERLSSEQLKKFSDITQALKSLGGVQSTRSGGVGGHSVVDIRGAGAEHVLVFINGQKQNFSYLASSDIGGLGMAEVDYIDVYKGHIPFKFGDHAGSGAINIVTKDKRRNVFSYAWSDLNSHRLFSQISMDRSWGHLLIKPYWERSKNDFKLTNDNGTSLNKSDDREERRNNNDFFNSKLDIAWKKNFGTTRVKTRVGYQKKMKKTPNRLNSQTIYIEQIDTLYNGVFEMAKTRPFHRANNLKLWADFFQKTSEYADETGSFSLVRTSTETKQLRVTPKVMTELLLSNHLISLMFKSDIENFKSTNQLTGEKQLSIDRRVYYLSLEDLIVLPRDWLIRINGQVFYWKDTGGNEKSSETANNLNFGVEKRIRSGVIAIHANRQTLLPQLIEKFGNQGLIQGNTNLKKQVSREVQLNGNYNWSYRSLFTNLGIGLYHKSIKNYKALTFNAQGIGQYESIGDAIIQGVEMSGQLKWGPWSLLTQYDTIKSENKSEIGFLNGNDLPGVFHFKWFNQLTWKKNSWSVYVQYLENNRKFYDRSNYLDAPNEYLTNLGVSFRKDRFQVDGKISNLFNDEVKDVNGFPNPKRVFSINTEWAF